MDKSHKKNRQKFDNTLFLGYTYRSIIFFLFFTVSYEQTLSYCS